MRDGAYFIDRDPNYFRVVLNYLRCGQLVCDSDIPLEALTERSHYTLILLDILTDEWLIIT